MKKTALLFLIGSSILQETSFALPQAPVTVAVKDWQGNLLGLCTTAGLGTMGALIPQGAQNLAQLLPNDGSWSETFTYPLKYVLKSIKPEYAGYTAGAGVAAGIIFSYLFWYQISKSRQVTRARKFFGDYLSHPITQYTFQDRNSAASVLAQERSLRNKALDDQSIVQALVEITNRLNVGIDALEAAIETIDPASQEFTQLSELKIVAQRAVMTIGYNQALFTIQYGNEYRDSRRTTVQEQQAIAQDRIAQAQLSASSTAKKYVLLELFKFGWQIAQTPLVIASDSASMLSKAVTWAMNQ